MRLLTITIAPTAKRTVNLLIKEDVTRPSSTFDNIGSELAMRNLVLQTATVISICWYAAPFAQPAVPTTDSAALVGAWKLTAAYTDNNRNSRLDAEERAATMPGVQDYLRLNADGTCEFYVHRTAGRYELQPRSDGSRKLVLFDKNNHKEDRGLIVSVSKNELVLLNLSTRLFSVYARQ